MANELSANINRSLSAGGITVGGVANTVTSDLHVAFRKTIPKNTTNARVHVGAIDVDAIQAIGIEANKDTTVNFNKPGTSTPTDIVSLKANKAVFWFLGDITSAKFVTVDFDDLFITTGLEDTLLKFVCAIDSTASLGD